MAPCQVYGAHDVLSELISGLEKEFHYFASVFSYSSRMLCLISVSICIQAAPAACVTHHEQGRGERIPEEMAGLCGFFFASEVRVVKEPMRPEGGYS